MLRINDIKLLRLEVIKLKEEIFKIKNQNDKLSSINKELLRELREVKMFNNILKGRGL